MKNTLNFIAEFKIKLARGNSLIGDMKNIVYITAGLKIIIPALSIMEMLFLGAFLVVLMYLLGYMDLNYWGLMQEENRLYTEKYNPHLKKINSLIKKR